MTRTVSLKMHKRFFYTTIMLLAGIILTNCTQTREKEKKKALFIILDGVSADVLEMVDTPNMDEVIAEGSYTKAYLGGEADGYSESPTVSAVGYSHIVTGVWSNKHNVYDNNVEHPNYNYWNIFRLLKEQNPEKTTAIYSSWIDNREKILGDGLATAGNLTMDIHFDGYEQDTLVFPHQEDESHIQDIDEHVVTKAAESIRQDGPDLSWVYLWYTDATGHRYGDSEEYYSSLRTADEQIGRIWDAIKHREANFKEDWFFAVTTDHGRRLPDGKGHGKQSERERTIWFITNESDTNLYAAASKPAATDLYPTIARHLNLEIPEPLEKELDGVSMVGEISVSHPSAKYNAATNSIDIGWKAWADSGQVRLLISTTNKFQEGGEDQYIFIKEVPLVDGKASIDVSNRPSHFYKIVMEAPENTVNRRVTRTRSSDLDINGNGLSQR